MSRYNQVFAHGNDSCVDCSAAAFDRRTTIAVAFEQKSSTGPVVLLHDFIQKETLRTQCLVQ